MIDAGVSFVAPASKIYVSAATLAGQDRGSAAPADYVADRDRNIAAEDRGSYRMMEDAMVLAPKRKADPDLALRRIFMWSSTRQGAASHARNKKLDRARGDLERLGRGLGGRHYPASPPSRPAWASSPASARCSPACGAKIGNDAAGKPTLHWHFDQDALAAEAASDGCYALLANLEAAEADAVEVLVRYKGQEIVERRYGDFKGPLAVAPCS
jgi:hypothetical protein